MHDQTLYSLLRQHELQAAIDVTAPLRTQTLYWRMPETSRIWARPRSGFLRLREHWRLARVLRGQYALIPWLAGIPVRAWFTNAEVSRLFNDLRMRPTPAACSASVARGNSAQTLSVASNEPEGVDRALRG